MKTWLIITSAPFVGTEQYYTAYSEENPLDKLKDWFYDTEITGLWENYSYLGNYEDELYDDPDFDEDEFWNYKFSDFAEGCNMEIQEMSEEDLKGYGYNGKLPEIILDER